MLGLVRSESDLVILLLIPTDFNRFRRSTESPEVRYQAECAQKAAMKGRKRLITK
jgi:hypothetical protein